jgi:hypothetical protein
MHDQKIAGQETGGEPPAITPAADAEPPELEEPLRRYADRVTVDPPMGDMLAPTGTQSVYQVADLAGAGFTVDRDAFYDTEYRPTLRKMVAHIITVEGPIFDDVLVQRIARAHGFARAAGRIRETVLDVVERKFTKSKEDGRAIFWPEGADPKALPSFRAGVLEQRDHPDIPLVELAALARQFIQQGAEPKEAAVMVGQELGLGRLRETARERFEAAAQRAFE